MKDENRKLINGLIVQTSKLNEIALEQLFNITKEELYSLISEYIQENKLRDKVLSKSYLKIYRKSKRFDSFTTDGFVWMCNITTELCLKYQKKYLKKQAKKNHKCREVK